MSGVIKNLVQLSVKISIGGRRNEGKVTWGEKRDQDGTFAFSNFRHNVIMGPGQPGRARPQASQPTATKKFPRFSA